MMDGFSDGLRTCSEEPIFLKSLGKNLRFHRRSTKKLTFFSSLSWGWNEDAQCGTIVRFCNDSRVYVDRANVELMRLAARGMTILVSSGDAGSPGRTNEGCDPNRPPLKPVFPGSSEWVTSVGATYMKQSSRNDREWTCPITEYLPAPNVTSDYSEGVTTWRMTGWTSGSGFSNFTATPEWQRDEVNAYLASPVELPEARYFNRTGRAYPDIAAFGHNCAMYERGIEWTGGDGTSCSAPMLAGVISFLNNYQLSKGRPVVGFANPLLYKMRRESPSTFNDVSEGDSACTEMTCCDSRNFGFLPAKGAWDPLSGVGTPRVTEILKYLDSVRYFNIRHDEL
jgi:tripeptidyl-peptidase-1